VRRLVRQILTAQGYEALEAASAEEALEVLANPGHSIALVLSDILMSGISGRELARRVKLERPGLPVLLMSGFDAHEGALEPGSASDVTVLPKPFRPRDLARAVKDAMGSKPAAPAESARD
ncbi:MAG: response regulator, partial [Planctomycetes bacterium]|nr:response regulator [Planctomycetota bacterium]